MADVRGRVLAIENGKVPLWIVRLSRAPSIVLRPVQFVLLHVRLGGRGGGPPLGLQGALFLPPSTSPSLLAIPTLAGTFRQGGKDRKRKKRESISHVSAMASSSWAGSSGSLCPYPRMRATTSVQGKEPLFPMSDFPPFSSSTPDRSDSYRQSWGRGEPEAGREGTA